MRKFLIENRVTARRAHKRQLQEKTMSGAMMQVATSLPVDLVNKLDRRLKRTRTQRAEWFRRAVYRQAQEEGLMRVIFDHQNDVYELHLDEVAA